MRNIKDVLLGDAEQNHIKGVWDITPVVTTEVITPAIVSSTGFTVTGTDTLLLDATGQLGSSLLSVARTNINMAPLANDQPFQFGIEMLTAPPQGEVWAVGFYIDVGGVSDAVIKNRISSILFNGTPMPVGTVFHYALSYEASCQLVTSAKIANIAVPAGISKTSIGTLQTLDLIAGSTTGLILHKDSLTDTLNIGAYATNSSNTILDLTGQDIAANGPILPSTHTVYVFALTAEAGTGLHSLSFRIGSDMAPASYDVTGTSYLTTPGTDQSTWDALFPPDITGPITVTTAQAVFPMGAKPGQFYKVSYDPLWNGITPAPFGQLVTDAQTILITNTVPGSEQFVAYVDNVSLEAGVNRITEPLVQQQTNILSSIADLGDLLQQTQDDVNAALLNAGEVAVYVVSPAVISPIENIASGVVSYNTFDEAYLYLITLPPYIKKRIVIDDRGANNIIPPGVGSRLYKFLENNITISCYTRLNAYSGYDAFPSIYTALTLDCTGIRLDKYSGTYTRLNTKIPFAPPVDAVADYLAGPQLVIDDDVWLVTSDNDVELMVYSQNVLKTGNNCYLRLVIFDNISMYPGWSIFKGTNTTINIQNNSADTFTIGLFAQVNTPHGNLQDTFPVTEDLLSYVYTGIDPLAAGSLTTRVIRHSTDLGYPNPGQPFQLVAGDYLFARSIDIPNGITFLGGGTVTLRAMPGVVLTTDNSPAVINKGTIIDTGVHWYVNEFTNGQYPAILNYGNYSRVGGQITAGKLFYTAPDPVYGNPNRFSMVDVLHNLHPSVNVITVANIAITPVSFVLKGLVINGVFGNTPLIDFTIGAPGNKAGITGITAQGSSNISCAIVNITGDYLFSGNGYANGTIAIDSININDSKGIDTRAYFSKNNAVYDYKNDPFLSYPGKKFLAMNWLGYGDAVGNNVYDSGISIVGGYERLEGFKREGMFYKPITGRKRKFRIDFTGNAYRLGHTNTNGKVSVSYLASADNISSAFPLKVLDISIPVIGTRYPFKITAIVDLNPNDSIFIGGWFAAGSNDRIYLDNIDLIITEL